MGLDGRGLLSGLMRKRESKFSVELHCTLVSRVSIQTMVGGAAGIDCSLLGGQGVCFLLTYKDILWNLCALNVWSSSRTCSLTVSPAGQLV